MKVEIKFIITSFILYPLSFILHSSFLIIHYSPFTFHYSVRAAEAEVVGVVEDVAVIAGGNLQPVEGVGPGEAADNVFVAAGDGARVFGRAVTVIESIVLV